MAFGERKSPEDDGGEFKNRLRLGGLKGGILESDVWQLAAASCLKDESVTEIHCRPIHPPPSSRFTSPTGPPSCVRDTAWQRACVGAVGYYDVLWSPEYVTRSDRPAVHRSTGPAVPPVSGPLANNTVGDIQYPGEHGTEQS